jgi:hypothetical protein
MTTKRKQQIHDLLKGIETGDPAAVAVEHWDTIETIPPRDQWKNDNGKF